MKKMYFVGQSRPGAKQWEFQGIFDTEQGAIDACINEHYFYVDVILNKPLPDTPLSITPVFPKRDSQR